MVREGGSTIILDGGESLTTAADEGRLGIPGTVHFAATVSSVDFSEFTVVSNGEIVRHLCYEDGETTIDVGEPVPGESRWLITADDGDDETRTGEPAEAEIEVDGDILIQKLPEMAGLSPDLDVFALVGAAYDAFEEQGERQTRCPRRRRDRGRRQCKAAWVLRTSLRPVNHGGFSGIAVQPRRWGRESD